MTSLILVVFGLIVVNNSLDSSNQLGLIAGLVCVLLGVIVKIMAKPYDDGDN